MLTGNLGFMAVGAFLAGALSAGCGDVEGIAVRQGALTADQRLAACAQDPRAITGLVSQQVCAGADIFFRETFNGNGRTSPSGRRSRTRCPSTSGGFAIARFLRALNVAFNLDIAKQPFYPVAVDRLGLAKTEIAAAIASPVSSRGGHISNAVSRIENARDQIGANVNYTLGQGNLMF